MALAGLNDGVGLSMFEHLRLDMKPEAEDMDENAKRVLYNKVVKIKSFHVKTFDLGDPKQAKAYAKVMETMYKGIQLRTHVILFNDRHFVDEGGKPRWVAHIEWAVFSLETTSNPTIPAEGDRNDAQAGST